MRYFLKKLITLVLTLLCISFITFLAFQVIPGDSAAVSLGKDASQEQIEALREARGLNAPVPVQYVRWLSGMLSGSMGESSAYSMPVRELLAGRFTVTMGLGVLSLILIVLFSVPIGILTSKKEGGILDRIITVFNQICMSVPPFFLGILITLLFGFALKWFVPGNYIPAGESFFGYIQYLLFPAMAVAVPKIAMLVKMLRSSILREKGLDYVRTARSKGNTENRILYHHILRNACIPFITFFGMVAADVLAGSMIIEQVFNLPGLGRLLIVSIGNRDYPVVQVIVVYMAALVLLINFLVDLAYRRVDPRIGKGEA